MTVLTAHPQRFGGLRERAVRIPQATLAEMGVEFDDEILIQSEGSKGGNWGDEVRRRGTNQRRSCATNVQLPHVMVRKNPIPSQPPTNWESIT